jgi:hypothetical protein
LHSAEVLAVGFDEVGRHLVTASGGGEVRRWPLAAPSPDDPALLDLWMQAAAGRRRSGGETALLDLGAWQERRAELRRGWPEADAELARRHAGSRAAWHEARAGEAEATGNAFALLWHLDRLALLRPDDWRIHARRGNALADAGDPEGARAAYEEARKRNAGEALADWKAHHAASRNPAR